MGQLENNKQNLLWLFVDSIIRLIKALSEASIPILDDITKGIDGLPVFLFGMLKPAAKAPTHILAVAVECLSSLTEDNDELTKQILGEADFVTLLMKLRTFDEPLVRICACAILHNLSLAPESDSANSPELSDALLLPTLTSYLKLTSNLDLSTYNSATATASDRSGLRAAEIALDVIGSIATALGYEIEESEAPTESHQFPHKNDDSDAEMGDIADEEEIGDDLRDDMEMVTVSDDEHDDNGNGSGSSESMARYLIDHTVPILIALSRPASSTAACMKSLRVRSLMALNNVAWTAASLSAKFPSFTKRWVPKAQQVWRDIVTPVFSENAVDAETAEAVSGVAWAVAKSLDGRVDLGQKQHHGFIALYRAAESDIMRVNCIGLLGCIGMVQDDVEVNKVRRETPA